MLIQRNNPGSISLYLRNEFPLYMLLFRLDR